MGGVCADGEVTCVCVCVCVDDAVVEKLAPVVERVVEFLSKGH